MALDASEGWIVMTNDDGRLEAAPIDNLTEVAFQLIRDVDPMNMNDYFRHSYEQVICVLQNLSTDGSYAQLRDQLKNHVQQSRSRDEKESGNTTNLQFGSIRSRAFAWQEVSRDGLEAESEVAPHLLVPLFRKFGRKNYLLSSNSLRIFGKGAFWLGFLFC